jgi:hypothetical protein
MLNGKSWRDITLQGNESDIVVAIADMWNLLLKSPKDLASIAAKEGQPVSVYAALVILGKLEEQFEIPKRP